MVGCGRESGSGSGSECDVLDRMPVLRAESADEAAAREAADTTAAREAGREAALVAMDRLRTVHMELRDCEEAVAMLARVTGGSSLDQAAVAGPVRIFEEKRTRLQAEATELSSRLERLRRLEAEGANLTEQLRVLSSTLSAVDVS